MERPSWRLKKKKTWRIGVPRGRRRRRRRSLSVNRRSLVRCGVGERETPMREKIKMKKKRTIYIIKLLILYIFW